MIRLFLLLALVLHTHKGISQNGFGFQTQLTLQLGAPINAIGMQTNFFYSLQAFSIGNRMASQVLLHWIGAKRHVYRKSFSPFRKCGLGQNPSNQLGNS